jgi:hypothetical protein
MESETISTGVVNGGKLRLAGVTFLVMVMACSTSFGLDFMGPPVSSIGQGRFSVGVDYSYSSMDLELSGGRWVDHLDGEFLDSGKALSLELRDFEMNRAYANLGFGLLDNLDAFIRLGVADGRFGDSMWAENEEFESNPEPAIGAGVRATFYENERFALGGLFQTSWARFDGRLDSPYWASADYVELDITEIQIALGTAVKLSDQVAIYGGPFFHFVDGTLDDEMNEADIDLGGLVNTQYSWDVKESSNFGGYIGASFNASENACFNIEYQHTSDADAIGVSFAWRF